MANKIKLINSLETDISNFKATEKSSSLSNTPDNSRNGKAEATTIKLREKRKQKPSMNSVDSKCKSKLNISSFSDIIDLNVLEVCNFPSIRFLSPPGRFFLQLYKSYIKLQPQSKVGKEKCPVTVIPFCSITHL